MVLKTGGSAVELAEPRDEDEAAGRAEAGWHAGSLVYLSF